jgi:SAM-dependent methyltransferase
LKSSFSHELFTLAHCEICRFSFVRDPRVDFQAIYTREYYSGEGADDTVDYMYDVLHSDTTTQRHEWSGIRQVVGRLIDIGSSTRWLDYGCGMGGLVEQLHREGVTGAVGFEQGCTLPLLHERNVPVVDENGLAGLHGQFDVVSAIEVLEHSLHPPTELRRIRSLLKPGGLFFFTTGNAQPFRNRLTHWRYVNPDIHISFFEPSTMDRALTMAGLTTSYPGFGSGWTQIYRSKLLHTLKRHSSSPIERVIPWGLLGRALESRLHLAQHPVGWVPSV